MQIVTGGKDAFALQFAPDYFCSGASVFIKTFFFWSSSEAPVPQFLKLFGGYTIMLLILLRTITLKPYSTQTQLLLMTLSRKEIELMMLISNTQMHFKLCFIMSVGCIHCQAYRNTFFHRLRRYTLFCASFSLGSFVRRYTNTKSCTWARIQSHSIAFL